MRVQALSEYEIKAALTRLSEWKLVNGQLNRTFLFKDFLQAFSFMTKVALEAEKLNHHPDWSNSYNRVSISLITHDIQALSKLDVELAKKINELT